MNFYRPQTKFAKVMFLQVSVCPHRGGARGFILGGVRDFIRGGMRGFISGGVWFYLGGPAWFYLGGHVWFYSGGMWFYLGGRVWFYSGGHAWFSGGVCGFSGGVRGFFSFFGYNEIRSMSGRYTSYWNAFLFQHENIVQEADTISSDFFLK